MNTRILKIGGSIFALASVYPALAADTTLRAKNASGTTVQLRVQDDASTLTPAHTVRLVASPTTDAMAQIDGHVDGLETLATAIDGHIDGVEASLTTIDGRVDGLEATTASILAKQPAFGTAGTASADVVSVQGIASGTNLNVACQSGCSGGTQYAEDAVAASGNTGTAAIGVQVASPASTAADGDWTWMQFTGGKLHVTDLTTQAAIGTASDVADQSGACTLIGCINSMRDDLRTMATDTNPLSVKFDQTTVGTTNAVSLAQIGATTVATGNGVVSAGVQRVAIASDNTAFSVNLGTIGGAATAAKQPALGTAGTASSDVISVQGIASMTPLKVSDSGTSTPVRVVSAAASTNLTEIADSGGCRIVSVAGAVARTTPVYLKFYNAADGSVTVGTTTPYVTLALPAGGTQPTSFQFDVKQVFASGACSLAMTTAVADNSTAALTAADVVGLTVIWAAN